MGRAKTSRKRKATAFKTEKALLSWRSKKSSPRWMHLQEYDPAKRLWVKRNGGGVAMVDAEKVTDHDGEDVYRAVYIVNPDGMPYRKWGFVSVLSDIFLRAVETEVLEEEIAVKLDAWIKSARENIQVVNADGWKDERCDITPCRIKIPNHTPWISEAQSRANMKRNISAMANLFMNGAFH